MAVGGPVLSAEEIKLNEIEADENAYFATQRKYKQSKGTFGTDPFYRYSITEYSGPKGKGYEVTIIKESSTTIEKITKNYGPETYREQGWELIRDKTLIFVNSTSTK